MINQRRIVEEAGNMASAAGDGARRRRKTACVTGGSGYIASALVKMLLEKGYAVKTTVRNPGDTEKNAHLKLLQALGPLEVFRADLDEEGSFDDAVTGCDYAFLVAAPVAFMPENPEEEVIEPAIRGTLNVMRSCVKAGTVKRVILTSSSATAMLSWTDVDLLRANKIGAWGYPASKVLAEKAAAAFAEESGVSLVTLCPVIVVGAAPAAKVKPSITELLSLLSGDDTTAVCTLNTTAVALARFLHAKYPQYTVKTDHIGGLPEKPRVSVWSDKLVREGFEYKYNTLEEIYDDVVVYGRSLGILPY